MPDLGGLSGRGNFSPRPTRSVFRQYPTWDDCIRGGIFTTPELERFFGPAPEGQKDPPGKANYAQCVQRGIGRKVIAKMVEGTENEGAIKQAIEKPPHDRAPP